MTDPYYDIEAVGSASTVAIPSVDAEKDIMIDSPISSQTRVDYVLIQPYTVFVSRYRTGQK
jgi:hypothetical protein